MIPSPKQDRLGGYRLVRQLGAGGMGVVHLGIHEETGAERAIKTLQTNDPELSLRFQREAEAMARLDGHPNIVRVHAFGQEGNTKYLVMDLARGGSLGDRLTKGPLKPGEAATLVRDLAQGLAQAHAAGILHRDLKPDNVLFGEDGTPKLTDFGLAKLADATSLTETGTIMGTPAYMSPEQADASKAVDARSDVYGLGAILYHALAGVPPFKGPSAMVILARVFKDSPQPPSAFSPVPAGLDRLCLQTLAKDPRERPHSATALDHALGTWLDTKASSRPPSKGLGVGLAALSLVLVATAGALTAARNQPKAPLPAPRAAPDLETKTATPPPTLPKRERWPLSAEAPTASDAADLVASETAETRDARRLLLEPLCRKNQRFALRRLGIRYFKREYGTAKMGFGLQLLRQAVKYGDLEAAGYLAVGYLEDEPEAKPRWIIHRSICQSLGLRPNQKLGAALTVITSQRTDSNRRAFQTLRDQAFDTLSLAGPVSKESRSLKAAYEIVREAFEPSSATQWEAQARASLDRCAKDTLTPLNELRLGVMLPEAIITWAAKYEKEAAKGWLGRAIHGWRKAAKEGDPETKSKAVAKLAEYLCKGGPGLVTVPLAGYRRLFLQAEAGSRHAALAMVRLHSKSAARAGEYNAELCEAWMRIATALTPHDDGPQFEPAVELGDTWALVRAHERRRASGH